MEHRWGERVGVDIPVRITGHPFTVRTGRLSNLSVSGAFIRADVDVRPLSPAQLAELRASVQTINCSNCGGPIDLVHASACAHCGTAISMLDVPQIGRMVEQLRNASADQPTIDPTLPLRLELEKQHVETLFATLRAGRDTADAPFGLVELGLRALSHWFI